MVVYKHNQPYYEFHFSDLDEDAVNVLSFEGEEEISSLFEYRIELVSKDPELDSVKILNKAATFIMNRGDEEPVKIHGIISDFEQYGMTPDYVFYKAVLVPQVWRLSLVFQNEVYQNMNIKDIIEKILDDIGLTGQDYKIDLKSSYPKKEYMVQYRETNLNFLKRRLEHYGIYFYFDHSADKDVIVFTDSNGLLKELPLDGAIGYNINKDPLSEKESVSEINCKEKIVTGMVQLKDYNYMFPEKQLMAQSQIDNTQPGLFYDFGEDFENESQAESLAKIRNQEFLCGKKIFYGKSDCRYFSAGYKFKLEKHYRQSWNSEYIITRVQHSGNQQGLFGLLNYLKKNVATYENYFTAIPSDIEYRPVRKTPVPRISGIMSAKIESGSGDEYAFIDNHGRYKAKMLFDISDKSNGEATLPIRLTQSYSGSGYGIHFPNHADTELLWSCVDGNPDRPIGLGTIPNPSNASPSTGGNKSQSVIRTAGQNELTFDDKTGSENIYIHGTKDWTIDITNDKNQKIGNNETLSVGANRDKSVGSNQSETIGANKTISVGGNHSETISGNMTQAIGVAKSESISAAKALTIGAGYQVTVGAAMNETVGGAKMEEVGAYKMESIGGNKTERVGNKKDLSTGGDFAIAVGGNLSIAVKEKGSLSFSKDLDIGTEKTLTTKAKESILIQSDKDITLKAGKAQIVLKKNGDITIKGNKINIKGSGDVKIKGSKVGIN